MARPDPSTIQSEWEARINRALEVKTAWEERFRVKLSRDYFEGRQNPGWPPEEWITVNKIWTHLQTQLPMLYQIDPYFYIKLRRSFDPNPFQMVRFDQSAKIREAHLNWLKTARNLKPKARLGIQDAHFAFGVMKVFHISDETENERAGEPILGDNEEPLIGDDGEPLIEPDIIASNGQFRWYRVHPDDFLFDADAGTLDDDWHWLAERIVMTPDQAKADRRLDNRAVETADKMSMEAAEHPERERKGLARLFSSMEKPKEGDRQVIVGWEIYDLERRNMLFLLQGAERLAMPAGALPPGIETHPYSILRFALRDKSPYPIPPVSQALDPQREFNQSRSGILRHRKRFNRKYEVLENMKDEELDKLEVGDDGSYIKVPQLGSVNPIKDAPLDAQNYTELLALNRDLVEIFGTPDEARGIASADSATQAALIDRRLEVREGDRLSLVLEWVTDSGKKMDQLAQVHLTTEQAVQVSGPQGDRWELVRPQDFTEIAGEFEYTVNIGASQPRIPQIERQQFLAFLNILVSAPWLALSPALLRQVAEWHHIDDERIITELMKIAQKLTGGGQTDGTQQGSGSQAGVGEQRPISAILGAATGGQPGSNVGEAA